jgi:hypothetical protein
MQEFVVLQWTIRNLNFTSTTPITADSRDLGDETPMLLVDNIAAMTPRCHTAAAIYFQLHELNLKWPPEPRAQSVRRYANLSSILSAPPLKMLFFQY